MFPAGNLHCRCGAPVFPEDVLESGVVVLRQVPLYRYVQYRCSHCHYVGEKLLGGPERLRLQRESAPVPVGSAADHVSGRLPSGLLGPISTEEITAFTEALARMGAADFLRLQQSLSR